LSIACKALENAEENIPTTQPATPTIQNEDLTDKQEKHSQASDDMRWHEVQSETVRIQHDEKSKQHESSLEPKRKYSESSSELEVKRKHHETSDDGSSDDDSSDDDSSDDDDVPLRRKHEASKPIIRRKPKHIMRRKLKIIPQLPPAHRLSNAIQKAASNPWYRASQSPFHLNGNNQRIMTPYGFSQY
jgi:hypothetical protein